MCKADGVVYICSRVAHHPPPCGLVMLYPPPPLWTCGGCGWVRLLVDGVIVFAVLSPMVFASNLAKCGNKGKIIATASSLMMGQKQNMNGDGLLHGTIPWRGWCEHVTRTCIVVYDTRICL